MMGKPQSESREQLERDRTEWLHDEYRAAQTPMKERDAFDSGWKAGYAAGLERAAQELERIRKVLCEGCKRDKPIVRPSHPSSIVGGAGIHTPEGWVCLADVAIEKVWALAVERKGL